MKSYIDLLSYPDFIREELEKEKKFIPSILEESNEYRKWFIEKFEILFDLKYEEFYNEIYEIQTLPEFDFVLSYCVAYRTKGYQYLRDKDNKHEKRPKEVFYNARDKFIKLLEKNNQHEKADCIKKIEFMYEPNYQDMLKIEKKLFKEELEKKFDIAKKRASIIVNLLDKIL